MSKRQNKTVSVFEQEQYDGSWPPENGAAFLEFFQRYFAEVPEEFKDSIRVEIDSVSSWEDSHYARISIEYTRPETDAEVSKREQQELARNAYDMQRAYQEFERLKKVFENQK